MANELSLTEIRFMRSLAAYKTDEQLAEMLEKPVELIQLQFSLMSGLPNRPHKKEVNEASVKKRKLRDQKRADKQKKAEDYKQRQSTYAQSMEHRKIRKGKLEKSILPTKEVNLTDRIAVRLNARTIVYVKPGTDIEELKKQYKIR